MQDRTPNRSNDPLVIAPRTRNRANTLPSVNPMEQASRTPALPTSRPQAERPSTGPINPVYIALITLVPLAILGTMLLASVMLFRPPDEKHPGVMAIITPGADPTVLALVHPSLVYDKTKTATHRRDGDKVYITGSVTNNSNKPVAGIFLKAFLYRPDGLGGQQMVGTGIGNTVGEIAPGATVPFTVSAQLTGGPVPKDMTTPTPPGDYETVDIQVDQVWVPAPAPTTTP
jgi:hypothetical protein